MVILPTLFLRIIIYIGTILMNNCSSQYHTVKILFISIGYTENINTIHYSYMPQFFPYLLSFFHEGKIVEVHGIC